MKRKLLNISGKIDPQTVAIYELIASAAESRNIKYFVIGATARDLVLHHGFGIESRRATRDIDLAVQVPDWGEYEELKKGLVETGHFVETSMIKRLKYQERIPVDIVPFGAIKEADGSISWPPDHEVRMNILGFEDACRDAMPVRLNTNPELDVLVASPTSQAALKLIAWKERSPANTRDAIDLIFIIRSYLDAGNNGRLPEEHSDLLDENFDYVLTGARLLGRDIANCLGEETITVLKKILAEQTAEGDRYPLVEDMASGGSRDQFEENLDILKSMKQGVTDITG